MGPRRQRAAARAASAGAGNVGIQQLPDDVLVRILGKLDVQDRHRVALVSSRWHRCVHDPELCRLVMLQRPTTLDFKAAAASLAGWLLRHGQHVRSLCVWCTADEALSDEAQAHLTCCLVACAAGRLTSLVVCVAPLVVSAWAPAMRSLRQLRLGSPRGQLLLGSSVHSLTQLTHLELAGSPIRFAGGVGLPASVQQLCIKDASSDALPDQIAGLSRLSALKLAGGCWAAGGHSVLTRLSALVHLELHVNSHLPACLGQLTGLQALVLSSAATDDEGQQASQAMNAALAPLTQLTSLLLLDMSAAGGLPALAGLSRLQRACFMRCQGLDSLPASPWSASLRELGAGWECLQSSRQLLAAAEQLRRVVVLGGSSRITTWLLHWAGKHPPLQQLQLYVSGQVPAELLGALLRLKQERPQLGLSHEALGLRTLHFERTFRPDL